MLQGLPLDKVNSISMVVITMIIPTSYPYVSLNLGL